MYFFIVHLHTSTMSSMMLSRLSHHFLASVTRVTEVHQGRSILVTLLADQGLCKETLYFRGQQSYKKLGHLYATLDKIRYNSNVKVNYSIDKEFKNCKKFIAIGAYL